MVQRTLLAWIACWWCERRLSNGASNPADYRDHAMGGQKGGEDRGGGVNLSLAFMLLLALATTSRPAPRQQSLVLLLSLYDGKGKIPTLFLLSTSLTRDMLIQPPLSLPNFSTFQVTIFLINILNFINQVIIRNRYTRSSLTYACFPHSAIKKCLK